MTTVTEKRPFTAHSLVGALEEFISDNTYSSDHDSRWLAKHLADTLKIARQVRSGGLDTDCKRKVAAMRYEETQEAIRKRKTEVDNLEREAEKLKVEAA